MNKIRLGTCSWKYDSWKGLVYPDKDKFNYLEEYSKLYDTVEVDQWFWSLFDKVVLPVPAVVKDYASSTPDDFLFTIKAPNSLTLTHFYKTDKKNPHFLSVDLFEQFLTSIEPLLNKTGSVILQFEYLSKQKISSVQQLMDSLSKFFEGIPSDSPPISVEVRNPNFLCLNWFRFLAGYNISAVLLEGYFMPPVTETYSKFKSDISGHPVVRLHGPDRSGIEELSGKNWGSILINRDESLGPIAQLIKDLQQRAALVYVNVNNHYEGSAPLTINKIKNLLE